jgi:hypothetical protein
MPKSRTASFPILALLLCSVAACALKAGRPTVWLHPAIADTVAWQEVPFEQRASVGLPRYELGGHSIENVDQTFRRSNERARGIIDPSIVQRDSEVVAFDVRARDGAKARVTATFLFLSEWSRVFVIGARQPGDDLILEEQTVTSRFDIIVNGDSSRALTVEVRESSGRRAVGESYVVKIFHDGRELNSTFVTFTGPRSGRPIPQMEMPLQARGIMISEGDVPLGVVQYRGNGVMGNNDTRAWLPRNLEPIDRLERATLLLCMVLSGWR